MLVGFDVVPQAAEEIDLPPNRIGWLLVLSVAIAVVWYGAVTISVAMSNSYRTGALASADAAASLWKSEWAARLLVLGGAGGILTTWNAFIIGGSRIMYALSESGGLPELFSRLHPRYRTPYASGVGSKSPICLDPSPYLQELS